MSPTTFDGYNVWKLHWQDHDARGQRGTTAFADWLIYVATVAGVATRLPPA